MKAFSASVDMSRLPGSHAKEILVRRTATSLFWCTAVVGAGKIELGPVVLGFDGTLTDQWHADLKARLLGDSTPAFLAALGVFLRQQGIVL